MHIHTFVLTRNEFLFLFPYGRVAYVHEEVTRLGERSKLHAGKNSSSVTSQLFLIYRDVWESKLKDIHVDGN